METSEDYGALPAPLARVMTEHVKKIPSRFTWNATNAPRERKPIINSLPWSPSYGPHICPVCYGAGWMRHDKKIGELEQCLSCNSVEQQQVNRQLTMCWDLGKIKPSTPNVPTFDTFQARDTATAAMLKAAMQFGRMPQGFLTIHGAYGTGKSHLAQAVARSLLQRRQPCLFINASNLFEHLGAVHRSDDDDTDYTGRMTWMVYVKVLIIDELNIEGNSKAVADLRRSLIDGRYQRAITGEGGATMIVSNTAPDGWYDQAVASRCLDTRFTVISSGGIDYRKVKQ